MRRPALSAQRAVQVIALLSDSPQRAFSMSEIMRATDLNVASCHALLAVLTQADFLARCPDTKAYVLGPTLVGIGQAALEAQPIVSRARQAAVALVARIGLPVQLTTIAADEIVSVFAIPNEAGRHAGLPAGRRVPLAPPMGAPFLAWSSQEAIDDWITRKAPLDDDLAADWRNALALVRERGFQITLKPATGELAKVMGDIAAGVAPLSVKQEWDHYFQSADRRLLQPDTIERDRAYDIVMIAAPIFDKRRDAAFGLCVSGFDGPVMGDIIGRIAEDLLQTCIEVMRMANA